MCSAYLFLILIVLCCVWLCASRGTQVVHAADLGNVARPYPMAAKWAALHAEEQWYAPLKN